MFEVIGYEYRGTKKRRRWVRFRCFCGMEKWVPDFRFKAGKVKSCGCSRIKVKHGLSNGPTYRSWSHMWERCTRPENGKWHLYGGRGIKVCERWRDFRNFYADMGPRPQGLTIDRIDNNGNYEPANCRWATIRQQHDNRRITRYVTVDGSKILLSEYAKQLGLNYGVAAYRLGFYERKPKKRSMLHLIT